MKRTTPLTRARSLIISALIVLSLVGVGYDSQPALKNQADEIDVALKAITKRISGGDHLNFKQTDIQTALAKLGKLSVDLSQASIDADAKKSAPDIAIITSVGAQYLNELFSFHVIYATAAHTVTADTHEFSYDIFNPYTLKLKSSTALDLVKQRPFNTRHLSSDVIEFFVNSQDKQLAEFFALSAPKFEENYSKLIQFSALRETFTNLWAIQRLSTSEIPTQPVQSCAPELLSFRSPPSGNLKETDAYLELNSSDRYTGLSTLVEGAFQKSLSVPFIADADYYEVLSKTLSGTDEFKTYTNGVAPKDVSDWLNKAAASIAKVEQTDWSGNAKNSEKILGGSTLINDQLSTAEIARRMSETVFLRRETAAIAQITSIAQNNIKVKDLASIQKKAKDLIDSTYKSQWIAQSEQQLSGAIAGLDQSSLKNDQASVRAKQKVADTLELAAYLMPAMHDYDLIALSTGLPVEKAEDVPRVQKNLQYVYLRPKFIFAVSDADTLKTYLLKEIQNDSSLWSNLQNDSSAMILLNSFFVQVAEDFKNQAISAKPSSPDQASRLLISVAQADAKSILTKASPVAQRQGIWNLAKQTLHGWDLTNLTFFQVDAVKLAATEIANLNIDSSQKLLTSAFAKINLLGAKNPTNLSPLTSQQEDLASVMIAQGYDLNPLLAVRTNGATVLERIYREALEATSNKQLDYAIGGRIVLEGIQTAAQDIQGKLEDFCQANVENPARDLRFRRLFRSASHLREALMHAQGANSDDLAKFDADLAKKTQTITEKILSNVIKPLFLILSAVMVVCLIISLFNPLTTIPALATLMVIANFSMIGLSAVSSYFEVSNQFFEQPAQVRYQEALASAQVSADEPFAQWDQLKSMGLISSVTNRASADQAKQALVTSQAMEIPQLAMNAWIGYGGIKQVVSNIGLVGALNYEKLAGAEMPGWAERVAPPEAKTFRETLREQGTYQAVSQKTAQVMGVIKNAAGLNPALGAYTSEEALNALKTALARVLPEQSKEILPEVELYRDFLKGRLKVSNSASSISYTADGTIKPPVNAEDEFPDFIKKNANHRVYESTGVTTEDGAGEVFNGTEKVVDKVRKFWTETPQLEGKLSWKEMLENPQLLKWRLIPTSAIKAARAGPESFGLWVRQYGSVVKLIDMLRGELIAQKLASFEGLLTKLQELSGQGLSTVEVLKNMDSQEMALFQEAAHGPRFLAYGYGAAKSAEMTAGSLPLRQSVDVFDTYNKMIESLKPNDWTPPTDTAKASSADQEDVRNFYRFAKTMDALPGSQNGSATVNSDPKVLTLEAGIERTLFQHAN